MSAKGSIIYKSRAKNVDMSISPCFQINDSVQIKDVPTNGEEYLLKVIEERRNISAVTKSSKDYSIFASNQSLFAEVIHHDQAPEKLKPSIEWQNVQVADFSDVRMYISKMRNDKSLWPKDFKIIRFEENNVIAWKNFFRENEPTLTCALGLRHSFLDRGLEFVTSLLDNVKPGQTINHKTGQWVYNFLACIKLPLLSETTGLIRALARKCAEIRSHLDPDDEESAKKVVPLNLFICLVSRYFRQYDLAD